MTRLYIPEDFEVLAVFASLLTLINVVSSMQYESVIPPPKDDNEAANLALLGPAPSRPADAKDLRRCLEKLIRDPRLRKAMACRARQRARESFHRKTVEKNFQEYLDQALA